MERTPSHQPSSGNSPVSNHPNAVPAPTGEPTVSRSETGLAQDAPAELSWAFLAPAEATDELGRLGDYRILRVLGHGGMGVVFLAEDLQLRRQVAVKAMLPEVARQPMARERFLREARAAAKLEHDHIVPIYQVGEHRGIPFIAMPLLRGSSLHDVLRSQPAEAPAMQLARILRIGREIALGLAAAQERGLVHRDIKPANIWLDAAAEGRVRILDFGLARLTEQTDEQTLTQSGVIVGTPAYMAPEQARGEAVDGRADLFSLGVILYRLCTGVAPFKGADPISVLMSVTTDEPPPPRAVNAAIPPRLSELVMKLLEKDPARRVESARVVALALASLETERERAVEAATVSLPDAPKRASSRNRWQRRGVAVVVGLLLLAGAVYGVQVVLRVTRKEDPKEDIPLSPVDKIELVGGPGPFDKLRREDIPADRREAAGGDKLLPEVVAILGESQPSPRSQSVSLAIHPQAEWVALGYFSGPKSPMTLWDPSTSTERPFPFVGTITALRLSHDGKILAIGRQRQPELWSVATRSRIRTLASKHHVIDSIQFTPDDRWVVISNPAPEATALALYSVADESAPPVLLELDPATEHRATALAVSPDGTRLAAATWETKNQEDRARAVLKLWDIPSGKLVRVLDEQGAGAGGLAFSSDGRRLYVASSQTKGQQIYIYEVATGRKLPSFLGHNFGGRDPGIIHDVAVSPGGKWVASCDRSGTVVVWNPETLKVEKILALNPPHSGESRRGITNVYWAPDGRHLLTRNADGTVYVVRLALPGAAVDSPAVDKK